MVEASKILPETNACVFNTQILSSVEHTNSQRVFRTRVGNMESQEREEGDCGRRKFEREGKEGGREVFGAGTGIEGKVTSKDGE